MISFSLYKTALLSPFVSRTFTIEFSHFASFPVHPAEYSHHIIFEFWYHYIYDFHGLFCHFRTLQCCFFGKTWALDVWNDIRYYYFKSRSVYCDPKECLRGQLQFQDISTLVSHHHLYSDHSYWSSRIRSQMLCINFPFATLLTYLPDILLWDLMSLKLFLNPTVGYYSLFDLSVILQRVASKTQILLPIKVWNVIQSLVTKKAPFISRKPPMCTASRLYRVK